MNLIDGKLIAEKIKDHIAQEVFTLCANSQNLATPPRRPTLAIILVGERPDSTLYVKLKERDAATVGIDTCLYQMDKTTSEDELLSAINFLNQDEMIDGLIVQLPLPENLDTDKIIKTINPNKDVDGFTPANLDKLDQGVVISPVFQAILACLDEAKCDLKNKTVALVGKSGIFTTKLDELVKQHGAQAVLIKTEEIDKGACLSADIIISAIGQAKIITADHIKTNAVLIDVGISQDEEGKISGDVDELSVADKASWLTPVPGGIGPLTVAFALKNTLEFFKSKIPKS